MSTSSATPGPISIGPINTANTAIAQAPDGADGLEPQDAACGRARAFYGRLYYFDLVQMYGPLTLKFDPTTTPTTEATRAPWTAVRGDHTT